MPYVGHESVVCTDLTRLIESTMTVLKIMLNESKINKYCMRSTGVTISYVKITMRNPKQTKLNATSFSRAKVWCVGIFNMKC